MALQFKLTGQPEVERALGEVRKAFGAGNVKQVLMPAAIMLRDTARANVPVGPGHFKYKMSGDSVHLKNAIFAGRGRAEAKDVVVGVDLKKAPQGWWLEYGTEQHKILPKNKKWLYVLGRFVGSVKHPGQARKPWFRPAMRSAAPAMFTVIAGGCAKLLDRAVRLPSQRRPDADMYDLPGGGPGWIG